MYYTAVKTTLTSAVNAVQVDDSPFLITKFLLITAHPTPTVVFELSVHSLCYSDLHVFHGALEKHFPFH